MDPGEKTGTTFIHLGDRQRRGGGGGGDRRENPNEEEGETPVWSVTEEAPSGWRSPPLPRLSAQTQTAPEEGKKV